MILSLITVTMFTNKLLVFIYCTTSPHQLHVYVAVPSNCIQHLEPTLQCSSFPLEPSQGCCCQGGKAEPCASPEAQGTQLSLAVAKRVPPQDSPWGLSLPWHSTPAWVIRRCSSHFFNTPSYHSPPSGKGGKQMHMTESIVQRKRPAQHPLKEIETYIFKI